MVLDKALLFIQEAFPHAVTTGFPLKAILVPRITHQRRTAIRSLSPAKTLMALAPSSVFLLPVEAKQAFTRLGALVQTVPCFELALGTDIAQIPQAIKHLIKAM